MEDNYRLVGWYDIELQVRQKKCAGRKSFRKRAKREFDRQKYGKCKLGERFFGNLEVRGCCYYQKGEYGDKIEKIRRLESDHKNRF